MMNFKGAREKQDYSDSEKSVLKSDSELEARFSRVEIAIPKVEKKSMKSQQMQMKKWLGELLKTVLSVAFKLYLNETFSEKQTKIFCCENLLYNIIKFV